MKSCVDVGNLYSVQLAEYSPEAFKSTLIRKVYIIAFSIQT